ncbi:DUF1731 domain-containing protein [Desulfosporosinus sp. SB140]|uniref:DUF1731 domain-containing protein n=1 Tax=Desulfosporosinus paludis TaxID=3115649 RepID=UPI00388D62F7
MNGSYLCDPSLLLTKMQAEMLLNGQRAIPEKIISAGFEFKFPELKSALEDILRTGI